MANKQDAEMRDDEVLDETDQGGSRVYELGFHLDPELPSEEVKKAYQAMHEFIMSKGGLVAEGDPQHLQLAYTISRQETSGRRDFDSAYFAWIAYETSAPNHAEVLTLAKEDKRIIRFIDLITTKDAARHSAELREMALKTPEPAEEPKASAEAELDAALASAAL